MGNVGLTSAEDPTLSMFYNPAGFGSVKRPQLEVFNPQLEGAINNFGSVGGASNFTKVGSLQSAQAPLAQRRKQPLSMGAAVFPNFSARNIGIGLLAQTQRNAYMDSAGAVHYQFQTLVMPTLGLSMGFFSGLLKLGGAVRYVILTEANTSSTNLRALSYRNNAKEGAGIALDAGGLLTLPFSSLPTFAFVARDIGGTRLTGTPPIRNAAASAPKPEKISMAFDGGFALHPKLSQMSALKFGVDYRDITDVSKSRIFRKVNIGMELMLQRYFGIRWGYGSGYWTFGLGVYGKGGELELGSYGKELTGAGLQGVEDRRILLRYSKKF